MKKKHIITSKIKRGSLIRYPKFVTVNSIASKKQKPTIEVPIITYERTDRRLLKDQLLKGIQAKMKRIDLTEEGIEKNMHTPVATLIKKLEAYLKTKYDIAVGKRALEELNDQVLKIYKTKIKLSGRSYKTGKKKTISIPLAKLFETKQK